MMLALACDYRVMTDGSKRNTWITMNEVREDFTGSPIVAYLTGLHPDPFRSTLAVVVRRLTAGESF